ncbi:prepilin-type N-terminal cleavage/methylation domain-containing protein [Natroniella sulfidigena]|uniref:type IV pilus modification PilV family protein n=1 Tax=Natroniella sulfidigena TaxID=723921 RepID=UPI00200A39A1|nr:prepilin-type N-terminal cleavage/methylation domain-containing protein [Natroniella sulfidigena]MCK8816851.1 prepilin-type N-terminal cleavage/methylation domain-containing protein [Natroniella sulfidigena]
MPMIYQEIFSKEEGFSLLEMVIGIAILSIVLIPTLSFFSSSLSFIGRTDQRTQALNVGQQMMEELKAQDFEGLEDKEKTKEVGNFSFDLDIEVEEEPDALEDIKKVTVTVSWEDDDSQKIELVTLITKR